MAKSKEIPEEGGNINWDKLDSKPEKEAKRRKKGNSVDPKEEVQEEEKKLSNKEQSLPYPDDFLADVNLMLKKSGVNNFKMPEDPSEPEKE